MSIHQFLGNLLSKGWDNIWIDHHSSSSNNNNTDKGEDNSPNNGGSADNKAASSNSNKQTIKLAPARKMPADYRWFTSSCGMNLPVTAMGENNVVGKVAALERYSLLDRAPTPEVPEPEEQIIEEQGDNAVKKENVAASGVIEVVSEDINEQKEDVNKYSETSKNATMKDGEDALDKQQQQPANKHTATKSQQPDNSKEEKKVDDDSQGHSSSNIAIENETNCASDTHADEEMMDAKTSGGNEWDVTATLGEGAQSSPQSKRARHNRDDKQHDNSNDDTLQISSPNSTLEENKTSANESTKEVDEVCKAGEQGAKVDDKASKDDGTKEESFSAAANSGGGRTTSRRSTRKRKAG